LTIPQGDSSGTISIATTQDATYEGDHHFTLTLGTPSHFNLGAATAVGTIEDDADAPAFAFSAASTDADEDDGTVTLTVSKTGTTLLDATVSYATKDGTAIGGSDFTAISSTSLAFAALDTSKAITVTISDDNADEPAEAFTVELSNPSDAQLGAQKSHSITITDDDKTAVTLSAPAGDISESGGSKVITVTLGRTLAGDETLAVPLTFSGAATFGADYALAQPNPVPAGVTYANLASTDLATSPPTIAFSGVAGAARSATITLSASADSTDEGASESVTVGIGAIATAPDGGASASGTSTFNITDDDDAPGGITLTVDADKDTTNAQDSVAEDGGAKTARVTATLDGSTTFDAATEVTVTVGKAGDAATSADYAASPASFTITIPAGESSATADFTLTPTNDKLDENDEALSLTGSAGSLTVSGATIKITDDDDLPALSIADASAVTEGGQATFTITLTPVSGRDVTVQWATAADADGTNPATAGDDYTAVPATTATIAAGQTKTTARVDTAADKVDEANETFLVNLSSPGNATLASADATATGTINDDDTRGLVLSKAALGVDEGGEASYDVSLATEPTAEVTVTISGHSNTGLTPDKTSLTFTTENWETAQTVTVAAADDADAVNDIDTLAHTASGGDYGSVAKDLAVTTTDGDAAGIVLDPAALDVDEGGEASYDVSLATEPSDTVTVTISGHTGTGLTPGSTSLTFTTENWSTVQAVTVSAADDDDADDDVDTLTHSASGGDYGSVSKALEVTTEDDDTPAITLSPDPLTVTEGGSASYDVSLATEPSGTVTVTISGHTGTGLSLDKASLTFDASNWSAAQAVTVSAGEDDGAGDDVDTLAHEASGGGYGTVAKDLEVTTDDNDALGFAATPDKVSVAEPSGTATYKLALSSRPTAQVTVALESSDTTAAAVSPASLTFTRANWSVGQSVTVTAKDDKVDNPSDKRAAAINLTASGGDYADVTGSVPVAVTDDDAAPSGVTLTASPDTLTENGGAV
ncbi:MAG: hypothetical protein F4122_07570, partial [Gammaproteobacteria bacterium]|nr:hypothetical protein [Gammaproteobacteria bacterium]